jgi:PAS domain S-box-containing protein
MHRGRVAEFRRPNVASVFLLVIGLLVSSVGLTYWLGLEANASNRKLTDRRVVIERLDRLLGSVTEAETGQRGYLLMGREPYLDPYHAAFAAIQKELAAIDELAAGGELSKQAVGRINSLTNEKLAELAQTIAEYREHGPKAALDTVSSDRGRRIMDELRAAVNDLRSTEESKYRETAAAAERATTIRTVVFLVTVFGNLLLLIWAYQRIADTIRVEEALRENEERFRLLFQQAAIGIKRLDLAGERMLEVNDRLCDILGYSRDELLKMSLADFTHADDLALERRELARLVSGEIPCFTIEKRCLRKDRGVIWVRVTNSVPFAHDARAPWWVSVVEDITERKRADAALLRTTAELARSNQDLEQFAYVASHDLQEPLRMVAGYLQLLGERYRGRLDEKADKYIAYAVDGAERMSGLIHDLLAYSRVNIRGEQFQKTSAEEAFCFALKNLSSAVEQAGAIIRHDPLPTVRADKTQLRQLFQNLIGNAVKFHSPDRKAEIRVSAREDDRFWHFVVEDNGIGFDEKYRDKMFLIFQRLQGRGKFPGTGIGLAICKRIVERHGGRIWANSRSGDGATFHFTIPVERAL